MLLQICSLGSSRIGSNQYRGALCLLAPSPFQTLPLLLRSPLMNASSILELNGFKRCLRFNVFPSGPVWYDTANV